MSLMRLPSGREGRLPSIPEESDENLPAVEVTFCKCKRQILATLISLGVFSLGNVFGWTVTAIPLLKETSLHFNDAVVASIFILGALLSGPVAAYSMLKLGRKKALICHAILLSIGWTAIALMRTCMDNNSAALILLYFGRLITGFAGAGCFTIAPVYVGEIVEGPIHSLMESLVLVFQVSGNFVPLLLGMWLSWFWLTVACCIIPPIFTVLLFWLPESPQYLLMKEKEDLAKKGMFWYTSGFTPEEQERLYKRKKAAVDHLTSKRAMRVSERRAQEERKKLKLTSRPVFRPLVVSLLLIFFQQASGINPIASYTLVILEAAGYNKIDPKLATVIVGLDFVIFYIVASLLVDRVRRKVLLLVSCIINTLMLIALGCYFIYATGTNTSRANDVKETYGWVPLVCCMIFISSYAVGMGSMSWVILSEISHPDFREITGFMASTLYWLIAFVTTLTFPYMVEGMSYYATFWGYIIFDVACLLFTVFCVFETYGKTQSEIMAHYKGTLYSPKEEDDEEDASASLATITDRKIHKKGKRFSQSSDSSDSSGDVEHTLFPAESQRSMARGGGW